MKGSLSALFLSLLLNPVRGDDPVSSPSGKDPVYDPQHVDLSKSSALGNKTFSFTSSSLAQQKTVEDDQHRTFPTAAFDSGLAHSSSLQNQSAHVNAISAFSSKATGFEQPYATTSFTANQTSTLTQQPASGLQNKSSDLSQTSAYATTTNSVLNLKPYLAEAPEDSSVLEKHKDSVLTRMSTVPNRPLTIEEVRDLINHGVGPYGDNASAGDHKIIDDGSDITPPPAAAAPKSPPAPLPTLDKDKTP